MHFHAEYFLDPENRTASKDYHYAFPQIQFQNGSNINLAYYPFFDRLTRPFQVHSGIALPAGGYQYGQWKLNGNSDESRALSGNFEFIKGGYYSGNLTKITTTGTFRPTYRFSVEGTYTRNRVTLPEGAFKTHLIRSRIHYAFTTRMFLDGLIQYNSDQKRISSNLRFDFIHRPLSDLFLVYNEQRDTSGAGLT